MMPDETQDESLFAALHDLGGWDVNARRAHHLRARCRAALAAGKRGSVDRASGDSTRWTGFMGPALLTAWCAIYLIQIVRHAAAVYRL